MFTGSYALCNRLLAFRGLPNRSDVVDRVTGYGAVRDNTSPTRTIHSVSLFGERFQTVDSLTEAILRRETTIFVIHAVGSRSNLLPLASPKLSSWT